MAAKKESAKSAAKKVSDIAGTATGDQQSTATDVASTVQDENSTAPDTVKADVPSDANAEKSPASDVADTTQGASLIVTATEQNEVASTATADLNAESDVPGIYVRAVAERRCRVGFCFDRHGHGFADGVLSEAQIALLEADPLLKVERATFTNNTQGEENL